MARSILKIDRFEGGVNTFTDRRDIDDNQSPRLVDGNIVSSGLLKLAGGPIPFYDDISDINIREPGFGLFSFSQDYSMIDSDSQLQGSSYINKDSYFTSYSENGPFQYLFKLFQDDESMDVSDFPGIIIRQTDGENANATWTSPSDSLALYLSDDYAVEPIRLKTDRLHSNLRMYDSNFKNYKMFNKWFGPINRHYFFNKQSRYYNETLTPDYHHVKTWLYTHADCKPPIDLTHILHKSDKGNTLDLKNHEWPQLLSTSDGATQILVNESGGLTNNNLQITIDANHGLGTLPTYPLYLILGLNSDNTPKEVVEVLGINGNELHVRRDVGNVNLSNHPGYPNIDDDEPIYLYFTNSSWEGSNDISGNGADWRYGSLTNLYDADILAYGDSAGLVIASDYSLNGSGNSSYFDTGYVYKEPTGIGGKSSTTGNAGGTAYYESYDRLIGKDALISGNVPGVSIATNRNSWGRASGGQLWSNEFPGINFMYEFTPLEGEVEEGENIEDSEILDETFLKNTKYRFYATFIYDGRPDAGGQESALTEITPADGGTLRYNSQLSCALLVKWSSQNKDESANLNKPFANYSIGHNFGQVNLWDALGEKGPAFTLNPRITGCRIYVSSEGGVDVRSEKYLLLEAWFDPDGGIKKGNSESYQPWVPVDMGGYKSDETYETKAAHYMVSATSDPGNTEKLQMSKIRGSDENMRSIIATANDGTKVEIFVQNKEEECFVFKMPPNGVTYSSLNGHTGDGTTDMLYKCSAEVNGQRFVGNVAYPVKFETPIGDTFGIPTTDGNVDSTDENPSLFSKYFLGSIYGDRVVRAAVGQPDILVEEGFDDWGGNDGEEIVELKSFNDQLLIFKTNSLYVIDVSKDDDGVFNTSLNAHYKYKGISRPYHATDVEQGVAFINRFGLYVYVGEDLLDLTLDKINTADWNWNDNKSIGYDPIDRTLIIMDDITSSGVNSGWTYYLESGAWVKLEDTFGVSSAMKSNFVTTNNGQLVFSAFNSSGASNISEGLIFGRDPVPGGRHYIRSYHTAQNTDFTTMLSPGQTFTVKDSVVTQAEVTAYSYEFTHFFPYNSPGEANYDTLVFKMNFGQHDSQLVPHLFTNDYIFIDGVKMFFKDQNSDIASMWVDGLYEVVSVSYTEAFTINGPFPISDDDPGSLTPSDLVEAEIVRGSLSLLQGSQRRHDFNPDPFTDDDGGDEDVPDPEEAVWGYPDVIVLRRVLEVDGHPSNTIDQPYLPPPIDIDNSPGFNGWAGWSEILDDVGTAAPKAWETFNQKKAMQYKPNWNNHLMRSNNYFDGHYKADQVDPQFIILNKNYGEAQLGWNDLANTIYKFQRFATYIPAADWPSTQTPLFGLQTIDPPTLNIENVYVWDRSAKSSRHFDLMTKDLDFGDPAVRKRVYKVYITYQAPNLSNTTDIYPHVRVVAIVTTEQGVFSLYPNLSKCENYGSLPSDWSYPDLEGWEESLFPTTDFYAESDVSDAITQQESKRASIVFYDPDRILNNCLSLQLRILNTAKRHNVSENMTESGRYPTSNRFAINDISIVYRGKRIK